MLGYYNYTVILTYISVAISALGMHLAITGNMKYAMICLILSGACDMFDGPIARTMERTREEKEFGIQIDSLADLICFGVFPAVLGYTVCDEFAGHGAYILLVLYLLGALIRLAYFNVQESIRQQQTTEKRKYYQGLPVTTAALIFPMVYAFSDFYPNVFMIVYMVTMLAVSVAFITNFKIKKAGKKEMAAMAVVAFGIFIKLILL